MPIGLTGFLGLGRETTWGTPVAVVRYAPLISETLVPDIEQVGSDNVLGQGISQQLSPATGLKTVAGEVTVQARPAFLGDLLRGMVNLPVSTVMTVGQSFSHVFKPRNASFADTVWGIPYTSEIFKGVGTLSHQFAGIIHDTLEVRWGARDRLVVASVGVIGKLMPVFIAKTTPSVEATLPFTWNQCAVTLPDPTAFTQFTDLTLRLSWGLRAESLIDQTQVVGIIQPDQLLRVELSGTMYPFTTAEFTEFLNQTERLSIMTFDSGVNIGASTDKFLLRFKFPKLRYVVNRYSLSGVGLIAAEITAAAFYDTVEASAITVTLQNGISAYA